MAEEPPGSRLMWRQRGGGAAEGATAALGKRRRRYEGGVTGACDGGGSVRTVRTEVGVVRDSRRLFDPFDLWEDPARNIGP